MRGQYLIAALACVAANLAFNFFAERTNWIRSERNKAFRLGFTSFLAGLALGFTLLS